MIRCQICNEIFKFKSELARHIDDKHFNIGQVEYFKKYMTDDPHCGICLVCNKPLETEGTRFNFSKGGFRRKVHKQCSTPSKEHWLLIYGKEEGTEKWNNYCRRQSETNTFEYKQKTYGWTAEDFENYNKSRAITLDNLISKYGINMGKIYYEQYIEKQKDAGCSLNYFQEKYGIDEGLKKYKEVNDKKRLTLDNFIKKNGEKEGKQKYNEYIIKFKSYKSNIATEFFKEITNISSNVYYGENEFGLYDNKNKAYYRYDFTDIQQKKIIEFNGDYWHPKSELDENFHPYTGISSQDAWKHDRNKEQCAIDNGYQVLYIWEHEVLEKRELMIQKCIDFLGYPIYERKTKLL